MPVVVVVEAIVAAIVSFMTLSSKRQRNNSASSMIMIEKILNDLALSNSEFRKCFEFQQVFNILEKLEETVDHDEQTFNKEVLKLYNVLHRLESEVPLFWKVMDWLFRDQLHKFRFHLFRIFTQGRLQTNELVRDFFRNFLINNDIPCMLLVPGLNYFIVNDEQLCRERLNVAVECLELIVEHLSDSLVSTTNLPDCFIWSQYWEDHIRVTEVHYPCAMERESTSTIFDMYAWMNCGGFSPSTFLSIFQDWVVLLAKHEVRMQLLLKKRKLNVCDVIKQFPLSFMTCYGESNHFSCLSDCLQSFRANMIETMPDAWTLDQMKENNRQFMYLCMLHDCIQHVESTGMNDFVLDNYKLVPRTDANLEDLWALKYVDPDLQGLPKDTDCRSCQGEGWWMNRKKYFSPATEEGLKTVIPAKCLQKIMFQVIGLQEEKSRANYDCDQEEEDPVSVPCYFCNYYGTRTMTSSFPVGKTVDSKYWEGIMHPMHLRAEQERKRVRVDKRKLFQL